MPELTGQTSGTDQSELVLKGGYLVYSSTFGGDVVDEFTVKDYLDNSQYEQVATNFFNYLQSNFTKQEFNDIYYSNRKLSNVFNDFYDKTIRFNVAPTKTVGNLQLTASTAVTYTNTNFIDYNTRSTQKLTVLMDFNTGDSYYVTVPINRNYTILDNPNYDKYTQDTFGQLTGVQVSEQFRYAYITANTVTIDPNQQVNQNSFNDFSPLVNIALKGQPDLRIEFESDKFIIPLNQKPAIIPINIVFDIPAPPSFQTTTAAQISPINQIINNNSNAPVTTSAQLFSVNIVSATGTAPNGQTSGPPLVGTEITLSDGMRTGLIGQSIVINSGQTSATINLAINSDRIFTMSDLNITLALNYPSISNSSNQQIRYNVSNKTFQIIKEQPIITNLVSEKISVDYVKSTIIQKPQYLIQSFVDLNFNDNESEFWLNPATSGFPPEYTIATPPVQPPPPAPTVHTAPVISDLNQNSLYKILSNLGYTLKSRTWPTQNVITMDGNNSKVFLKVLSISLDLQLRAIKENNFKLLGFNSITYDVTSTTDTNRYTLLLREFFAPVQI